MYMFVMACVHIAFVNLLLGKDKEFSKVTEERKEG